MGHWIFAPETKVVVAGKYLQKFILPNPIYYAPDGDIDIKMMRIYRLTDDWSKLHPTVKAHRGERRLKNLEI